MPDAWFVPNSYLIPSLARVPLAQLVPLANARWAPLLVLSHTTPHYAANLQAWNDSR